MCVAIPAKVLWLSAVRGPSRPATVQMADGTEHEADLMFVPEATPGDYVIVHSGFAVARLSEMEAAETFALLKEGLETT